MVRASGILLHPTSLPGPHGVGDLGPAAYRFVDALAEAGQSYWQVLPLGPTGYGDSPYQTFSAFAGNPLLVSPELLVRDGLLPTQALDNLPSFPADEVDYGPVIPYKKGLLARSFAHFQGQANQAQWDDLGRFTAANAAWLTDFALFMAIKEAHGGVQWTSWAPELVRRDPEALREWRSRLEAGVRLQAYEQYLFFGQWTALRRYANRRGVRLIGDAPIFVAHDSADCWGHPELFHLNADGLPTVVAGVPPDYFSETGQLWGNPLYRWEALAATGYSWWVERLRTAFSLVDLLRLDHFRGFAAYWEIPAAAPTAQTGVWRPAPGAAMLDAARAALGALPIIAEDLGVITPDVEALRDRYGFPGMSILQFAFGSGPRNPYLPHNFKQASVVYTGTHDNDTTAGWYATASEEERHHAREYLASDGSRIVWDLVRLGLASVADTAITPLQDLLELGSAARMNRPGVPGGNWRWRYSPHALSPELLNRLKALTELFGRANEAAPAPQSSLGSQGANAAQDTHPAQA